MKCPKCGYVGFESGDRCRHCGYDFSLSPSAGTDGASGSPPDLEDHRDDLLRIPRHRGGTGGVAGSEPSEPASPADLPLFDDALFGRGPGRPTPRARAPIPVRRSTPPVPRMRPRPMVVREPEVGDLNLELDAFAAVDSTRPPDERTVTGASEAAAGAGARLTAGLLDLFITVGLDLAVVYLTMRLCRLPLAEIGLIPVAPLVAFLLLLNGGYHVLLTAFGGQTLGQMATGIRVEDETGDPVVFSQALVRTFAFLVSLLPLGFGLIPVLFGQGRRALHDRLTNTRVVRASS
jgi:uncharacterized RDD family membrane protein YckC